MSRGVEDLDFRVRHSAFGSRELEFTSNEHFAFDATLFV